MAKKKESAKAVEEKKAPKAEVSEKKTKMTPEEKAAKRKARMEALKKRPAVQRPNSKQIDIIDLGEGGKVLNFGYPIKKKGVLVTSVAVDAKGNVVSTALTLVEGTRVKTKKGHGSIQFGVAGVGKGKSAEDEPADEEEDDDEEEEEEEDDED